MIERIVFTIGAFSARASLAELCADKAGLLLSQGVSYPDSLQACIHSEGYTQELLYFLADGEQTHSPAQHLRAVDDAARKLAPSPSTMHLAVYGVLQTMDRLPRLQAACRAVFPQAEQCALLCFARQDLELECICRIRFQRFELPGISAFTWLERKRKRTTPDYERCLRLLYDAFGRDAVHCAVPEPGVPAHRAYAASLCEALGLAPAQIKELGIPSFSPRHDILLPREVLRFASVTNMGRKPPVSPGFVDRWSFQAHKFAPGNGCIGTPHSLIGPKMRAEIFEQFANSNAAAAGMLGIPRLFPDPDPEPGWEPGTSLAPDIACKVAERLDTEFVRQLLEPFEKLPIHYLTREQRIVHQALRDVLDPPSATPLIQPHREEAKLSVLTLTYNHASYIAECIESVLAQQTTFPIQHIIADDASDDGTQDIILDYAARYPHIVPVFQKKRSGGPRNVHALFDMARTEYVALCDGDDYFTDPAKLQIQVDLLDANQDAALCFHVVRIIYEDGSNREGLFPAEHLLPHGEARPFYDLEDLFIRNPIQTNSVMYRWRFTQGLPDWFRTDLTPGDWYWHLLHAETGKAAFLNKEMSVYRRHEKGVYYLAEVDRDKHRALVGMKEIEAYDVINKHFKRKFEPLLLDLITDVFSHCMLYDLERAKEEGAAPVLDKLYVAYPGFARHFLAILKSRSVKK